MSAPNFPNVRTKLSAPAKKSAFEKQRLEAEAKRLREEAETAAVYKDFVASFDDDEDAAAPAPASTGAGRGAFMPRGGAGRRHFNRAPAPIPGPATARKRRMGEDLEEELGEVFMSAREKKRMQESNTGLLAFENSGTRGRALAKAEDSDSDSGKPHPKPTVLLSSLPPNITKATITDILSATTLKIDSIRIIPAPPPPGPQMPSPAVRKAATALVTLSADTPSSDIDAAVSLLNGRYIGFGFWLTIVRHLSSTVAGSNPNIPTMGSTSYPFGAKAPRPTGPTGVGRGGPHRGGFAPPQSFAPPGARSVQLSNVMQVVVQPPSDLKTLKLIHRTVENLLTHGPEFEALLMSKDAVRSDEKFAWLWDARSPAGVYYRWKIWEIVTGYSIDKTQVPAVDMFDTAAAGPGVPPGLWVPPKKTLKYEWAGSLKDVVDDEGFMSDELDEDESDREDHADRPVGLVGGGEGKKTRGYLGVLERAKLIHLISRMPTQTSKVRRGDVARVMAFALEHAEGGMGEEIVDVLVSNILSPLSFTTAACPPSADDSDASDSEQPPQITTTTTTATTTTTTTTNEPVDTSPAKIVALWLVSDVLSNSSLGVRAAWRYRQLFDTALRSRRVFQHLGAIYRHSGWGRMKAEKFRRGVVEGVLEGWEKWCIFPQTTQEAFLEAFLNPDGVETAAAGESSGGAGSAGTGKGVGKGAGKAEGKGKGGVKTVAGDKSRWKTVDATPSSFRPVSPAADADADVDGVALPSSDEDDVDGEPLADSSDEDGDGDVDMLPAPAPAPAPAPVFMPVEPEVQTEGPRKMAVAGFKIGGGGAVGGTGKGGVGGVGGVGGSGGKGSIAERAAAAVAASAASAAQRKRQRPRAEDMFADSD
ncbi:hypothetical protein EDC01DRAFT_722553 [Geopyxis carbonaria]|nr:hypothetical protein EDC01DRAFT_722553 [Geopyxis carbonaria]